MKFLLSFLDPQHYMYLSFLTNLKLYSLNKLYSNVLKWQEILSPSLLKELALDSILNRYLMTGLQNMETNMSTIEIIEYVI